MSELQRGDQVETGTYTHVFNLFVCKRFHHMWFTVISKSNYNI